MLSGANGTSFPVLQSGYMISPNYQVVGDPIGSGGMGAVYEVVQVSTGQHYALKLLHPSFKEGDTAKRFLREIELGRRLGDPETGHPNIVQVIDHGERHGVPFYVMEMLTGEDLATRLKNGGAMTFQDAYPILMEVIDALAFAHDKNGVVKGGVVHRDLKPENIFLCSTGAVKLLDFGIAKVTGEAANVGSFVTRTSSVLGTPYYMSPEQALGRTKEIDQRTDIFALGAIIYKMLSGRSAFAGDSVNEILMSIADESKKPPSIRDLVPGLPLSMHYFVEKALAKKPENRFQSMYEVGNRLRSIYDGIQARSQRPPARPVARDTGGGDDIRLMTSPGGIMRPRTLKVISNEPAPRSRGRAGLWFTLVFLALAGGFGAAYYFDAPYARSIVNWVARNVFGKEKGEKMQPPRDSDPMSPSPMR